MREPDPRWIALLTAFCTRRPSNEEVRAVLSEAFDPDLVLQSGDQLLGDLYFSLLHAATGEEDLTPREAAYFLACLQGRTNGASAMAGPTLRTVDWIARQRSIPW